MSAKRNPQFRMVASRDLSTAVGEAARQLERTCKSRPKLGVILGTGFGAIPSNIDLEAEIPFGEFPNFAQLSVRGHAGKLVVGHWKKTPVLFLSGRAHYYEGHSMEAVTFGVRVMAEFGIRDVVLTNAAGGIKRFLQPGDFMLVKDHINFMSANPLRGSQIGMLPRFVDLTQVYDPHLQRLFKRAAKQIRVKLQTGIYLAVSGPSYETPAEIRAFARLGADAVGMSTVPEAIVARQCGLAVAAVSCITNLAAGIGRAPLTHEEVLATGAQVSRKAAALLQSFVELYGEFCGRRHMENPAHFRHSKG